jgi:hypothetical protein
MTSKTLFAVLALAALVATPALAAKKPVHHSYAPGPYASATTGEDRMNVAGTDPDPSVRFELERDWQTSLGAN